MSVFKRVRKTGSLWPAGACLCLCGALLSLHAQTNRISEPVHEYELKAAFLYNFGRFVQWPEGTFESPSTPLVIGVVNPEPFKGALERIRGKRVGTRLVEIRHCRATEEMAGCHILFLNGDDELWIKTILRSLSGRPILLVGEREGFVRWGGILNFYTEDDNVRLEANREAAERAGLRLSAELLDVARIRKGAGETGP